MANSNGVITAPIGLVDVQQVLGESSTDLATLCLSNNINMWAKYKPIVLGTVGHNDANWWKGTFGNCGIRAQGIYTTQRANIPSLYTNDQKNGWEYEKPSGGSSSPYRLADFEGYNHNAIPPIANFGGSSRVVRSNACSFSVAYNAGGNSSLAITDISVLGTSFADMYFGVLCKLGSTSVILTSDRTFGNGGDMVTIPRYTLSLGNYTVYPFLAENQIELNSAESVNTYYSLPNVAPASLTVVSSYVQFYALTEYVNSSTLRMMVTLYNNDDSAITVKEITAYVRNYPSPSPTYFGDVDKIILNTDTSIPANSSYSTTVLIRGWSCINGENVLYCHATAKYGSNSVSSDEQLVSLRDPFERD